MTLHDLILRPAAAPLLLLLPILWYLLRRLDRARAARLSAIVGPRAETLAADLSALRRAGRRWLALIALGLGLVAILEPTWGGADAVLETRGRDLIVALDVSRSMLAEDIKPSRLERARDEIVRLARSLSGDRIGLVIFAGEARLMSPLTRDIDSFEAILKEAVPEALRKGGTDLELAIEASRRALDAAESESRSIVVLTDGEDQEGRGESAAREAHEAGLEVQALGLGSALGAKIPVSDGDGKRLGYLMDTEGREVISRLRPESLIALAEAGGGSYAAATEQGGLIRLMVEGAKSAPAKPRRGEEKRPPSRYQWPLALAFLLLVVELAMTDRRRP